MVRMTDLLNKVKKLGMSTPPPPEEEKPHFKEKPPAPEEKMAPVEKPAPEGIGISRPPPEEEKPHFKEKPPAPEKREPPIEKPVEFAPVLSESQKGQELKGEDISQELMKAHIPKEEDIEKLYYEAAETVKKAYNSYRDGVAIDKEDVINTSEKIVNNVILNLQGMLKLFHEIDSLEDYSYYNAVNVSILSVAIGIVYRYNKSMLLDLATVGLLHDMDLIKNKHVIDKSGRLSDEEWGDVRKHPLNTATYLDHAFNFSEKIINAILQHHERKKGQGYPAGLVDTDIHELAKIVGVADTYEAMIHSRPYKQKMSPAAAILNIINAGNGLFSNEAVKALVSCVSLYPVGTWVELNTGEICKVIKSNRNSPLRPVVTILMDKDRNKFKEVRMIDLEKVPSLYIKEAVDKKE